MPKTSKKPPEPADQMVITDLETLKVLTDPMRLELLELMAKPVTVKEVAKALKVPPTKLYYHVGQLEEHKIVRVVDTRIVSGIIEKQYQVTAKSYSVDRKLLAVGKDDQAQMQQVFHNLMDGVSADIGKGVQSGLIQIGEDAPRHKRLIFGRSLYKLTAEQATELSERMEVLFKEFSDKRLEADPKAASYSLFVAFHPHTKATLEEQDD